MKIALIGYGKMGKEIEKVALSRGHEIVSIIDINNQDDFESEVFFMVSYLHFPVRKFVLRLNVKSP